MARKKGGGGKLNRSEIIQARLDPKLHTAAEIMARIERRTLSSFIEKSIEEAAKRNKVKRNLKFLWWMADHEQFYIGRVTYDEVSVERAVDDIGVDHEAVRFLKFATYFPELLTTQEKQMFFSIVMIPHFWCHYPYKVEDKEGNYIGTEWEPVAALEGLDRENFLKYWDEFKADKYDYPSLSQLQPGRKIDLPLKEDVKILEKKIVLNAETNSFKKIYESAFARFFDSADHDFWKTHIRNFLPKKYEIRHTDSGPQLIVTLLLPENQEVQKAWLDLYVKKTDGMKNGS